MASIIMLPTHTDPRGSLTVLDKALPFNINRIYWIYDLSGDPRAQHRHRESRQALICLSGGCDIFIKKYEEETLFKLTQPDQVLLLEPEDWHETRNFLPNTVMLLIASHHYDPNDYIKEPLV